MILERKNLPGITPSKVERKTKREDTYLSTGVSLVVVVVKSFFYRERVVALV